MRKPSKAQRKKNNLRRHRITEDCLKQLKLSLDKAYEENITFVQWMINLPSQTFYSLIHHVFTTVWKALALHAKRLDLNQKKLGKEMCEQATTVFFNLMMLVIVPVRQGYKKLHKEKSSSFFDLNAEYILQDLRSANPQ